MDPVAIALELLGLVLRLVEPEKAKQLLDQRVVEAANLAADLEEAKKWPNG